MWCVAAGIVLLALPLLAQRLLGVRDHRQRLVDLGDRRQHRDQDPHLAVVRRAEDRPQLRLEELRLGEAEADRAQPQRGIGRDAHQAAQPLLVLVGAQIEGPDGDREAAHPRRDGANASIVAK